MTNNLVSTALVTGGSGFIGINLVRKLIAENIRVRVLLRPKSAHVHRLKGFNVDIIDGDLADPEALNKAARGTQKIYHVGAAKKGDRDHIYHTNIKGTEYLIEAALAHRVERFVQISDTEIYDLLSVKKGEQIREDAPIQKNTKTMSVQTYCKTANEKAVFDAYDNNGLGVTVVRPGMVVGPTGQILFPHLGYQYGNKLFFVVGKGTNILPLICAENLVDGIYRASIEDAAIGQAYNLVDDLKITVRDYLEQFIKTTGIEGRIVSLPYMIPYLAVTIYGIVAYLGLFKKGVTSRLQFRWKHAPMLFDNSKAKNDLGWKPIMPLREGLANAFKWYAESFLQ